MNRHLMLSMTTVILALCCFTGSILPAIADEPCVSSSLQTDLSKAKTSANADLLRTLAAHPSKSVQEAVASNPRTPPDVLIAMANKAHYSRVATANDDRDVIFALIDNPVTPAEAIATLIKRYPSEFDALPRHPNAPPDMIAFDLTHDAPYCKEDPEYAVYEKMKAFKNQPAALLNYMANSKIYDLQAHAASNRLTPPDTLLKLAATAKKSSDMSSLLEYMALNPACPQTLLQEFSQSQNYQIQSSLTKNTACPKEVLRKFSKEPSTPGENARKTLLYFGEEFHVGSH